MGANRVVGLFRRRTRGFDAMCLEICVGRSRAIKCSRDADTSFLRFFADVASGGFEKLFSVGGESFEIGHDTVTGKASLRIHSGEVGFQR